MVAKLLEKAFDEAAKLSEEEQRELAEWILAELDAENRWGRTFSASQGELAEMADEALDRPRGGVAQRSGRPALVGGANHMRRVLPFLLFLFILAGLLPWQFFSQGVLSSMASITSNSNLVKKAVGFPSELLPIVAIISNFISHLIGMGLFMVVYVAFEKQLPLYAPVILIYLFMVSVFSVVAVLAMDT